MKRSGRRDVALRTALSGFSVLPQDCLQMNCRFSPSRGRSASRGLPITHFGVQTRRAACGQLRPPPPAGAGRIARPLNAQDSCCADGHGCSWWMGLPDRANAPSDGWSAQWQGQLDQSWPRISVTRPAIVRRRSCNVANRLGQDLQWTQVREGVAGRPCRPGLPRRSKLLHDGVFDVATLQGWASLRCGLARVPSRMVVGQFPVLTRGESRGPGSRGDCA